MGVLLVVNPDLDVDGSTDAGVALFRAFNYLSEEERPLKALEFITEVSWEMSVLIYWVSEHSLAECHCVIFHSRTHFIK